MHYLYWKRMLLLEAGPAVLDVVVGDVLQALKDGLPPQRRRNLRDWRSQNRCIGDLGGDSCFNWITELSNWMIGCDVSGPAGPGSPSVLLGSWAYATVT